MATYLSLFDQHDPYHKMRRDEYEYRKMQEMMYCQTAMEKPARPVTPPKPAHLNQKLLLTQG